MTLLHERFKLDRIFQSRLPSAGSLAMNVWRLYVENFRSLAVLTCLTLAAFPFTLFAVLSWAVGVASTGTILIGQPGNPWLFLSVQALAGAAVIAANVLARPAITLWTYARLTGREIRPETAFRRGLPLWRSYLFVLIVFGVIVAAGFALWFVPGIIVGTYLMFSEQALVLGGKTGFDALRRSAELVKGRFWAVLWRTVIVSGLFFLGSEMLRLLLTRLPLALLSGWVGHGTLLYVAVALSQVVSSVIIALAMPLFMIYQVLVYAELERLKKA